MINILSKLKIVRLDANSHTDTTAIYTIVATELSASTIPATKIKPVVVTLCGF